MKASMKTLLAGTILNLIISIGVNCHAADTDSIFVDTNGNVGIGTTSPQKKIHVSQGSALFDAGFGGSDVPFTFGTRTYRYTFEGNAYSLLLKGMNGGPTLGVDRINGSIGSPVALADNDDIFNILTSGTNANGTQTHHYPFRVKVDGESAGDTLDQKLYLLDNKLVIRSSGKVGIGTADPSEMLTIVGGGINLKSTDGIGFNGDVPRNGNVSGDRARIYYDTSFIGTGDYLVIEKTDGNNANPDGGIAFTNKGSDNITEASVVIRGNGKVGIGTADPQENLDVAGLVRSQGNILTSDLRWKENVEPVGNALELVAQLRGVSYDWVDPSRGAGRQIGVIAQEVEQVLPEVVHTDSQGYKSVEYAKLAAPLIEAVKELKRQNDNLRGEKETLKKENQAMRQDLRDILDRLDDLEKQAR